MELFHARKGQTIFQKKNLLLLEYGTFIYLFVFICRLSLRQVLTETTLALRLGLIF